MCFLVTFAVSNGRLQPRRIEPWAGLTVKRFENDGGGHAYAPGMTAFSITDGQCSCRLYAGREQTLRPSVRAGLAACADLGGAVEFIVHGHRGRFDRERFTVTEEAIARDLLVAPDTETPCDVRFRVAGGRRAAT